jgi:hypothetical protein
MTDAVHFPALGHHVRLGRLAPRADEKTPKLATYLSAASLPPAPTGSNYAGKVPTFPMYANDTLGDCTCAAAGHQEQVWTANAGKIWTPTTTEVTDMYWGTGPEDTGRVEADVLNYWHKVGIGAAKRKIAAYASANPLNHTEIKQAIWLFGGLYIGIALPLSAQNQTTWRVVSGSASVPGSWGGHAVNVVGYTSTLVQVITWGMKMNMTWAFWNKYVDEAYAVLSTDWANGTGGLPSASGFNFSQLQTDLGSIR